MTGRISGHTTTTMGRLLQTLTTNIDNLAGSRLPLTSLSLHQSKVENRTSFSFQVQLGISISFEREESPTLYPHIDIRPFMNITTNNADVQENEGKMYA